MRSIQRNFKLIMITNYLVSVLLKIINLARLETAVEVMLNLQRADILTILCTSFAKLFPVDLSFLVLLLDLSK